MKKKVVAILATVALVSTLSTTAMARDAKPESDSSSSPNVFYGVGDYFTATFDSFNDLDYYSWYNDGPARTVFLYFWQPNYTTLDYGINSVGISGSTPGASQRLWKANGRENWQVYVPAGSTLTVDTRSFTYSGTNPNVKYELLLNSGYTPQ
ncbi:hypothetical protein GK047_16730 [Paenibacillus sp. SYP-B3998]|uniref:Uncharacterized protein n=1 Tax=Paenibacillus sp. SYP-B3998 TaxID=2678564 RepID=A0A6G4A019_9BACL|nr:hypothetical protein [Paenibacillus sp. SYP-B3998]NEW07648.1 hypothetical protein [Paenibacillus sp. SYP-B3998]